jgi:ribosomal protein L24E
VIRGTATDWHDQQGKLYVRGDSKVFRFQNGKTESLFLQRKNPRRIAWTMLYRRMHRKGISEVRHISPILAEKRLGLDIAITVSQEQDADILSNRKSQRSATDEPSSISEPLWVPH